MLMLQWEVKLVCDFQDETCDFPCSSNFASCFEFCSCKFRNFTKLKFFNFCDFLLIQTEITLTSWRNCPGNQSAKFFTSVKSTGSNKIFYSGYLDVEKEIPGPLELSVDVSRCDPEVKKCVKNPTQKFKNLCGKLSDKKAFYYSALTTLHPRLECPMKAQRYTATNSSFDLTPLTLLPISGHTWIITLNFYSGEEKVRELALCFEAELKIVRVGWRRH